MSRRRFGGIVWAKAPGRFSRGVGADGVCPPGEAERVGHCCHEGEEPEVLDDEEKRSGLDVVEVFEEELEEEHVDEERAERG